ncbi:hypothetical protein H0H81_007336, partial [Sphagnurus paluster]
DSLPRVWLSVAALECTQAEYEETKSAGGGNERCARAEGNLTKSGDTAEQLRECRVRCASPVDEMLLVLQGLSGKVVREVERLQLDIRGEGMPVEMYKKE